MLCVIDDILCFWMHTTGEEQMPGGHNIEKDPRAGGIPLKRDKCIQVLYHWY